MLERLTIENFQNIIKEEIDFDPYITCIVGSSDKGKSARIRALKWIIANRPSGTGFIRHGSESCGVKLRIDGKKVTRFRSRQSNTYALGKVSYSALGQGGVPEEIANLLNVSDLNFQNQLDGPFWFTLSAGEVSRQINQIVNLQLIDSTLSNITSELRKVRAQVQVSEERVEENKTRVKELAWAEEASTELAAIEQLESEIQRKQRGIASLLNAINKIDSLTQERGRLLYARTDALALKELAEQLVKRRERLNVLQGTIENIGELKEDIEKRKEEIRKVKDQLDRDLKGKCPLCKQKVTGELC